MQGCSSYEVAPLYRLLYSRVTRRSALEQGPQRAQPVVRLLQDLSEELRLCALDVWWACAPWLGDAGPRR